MATTKKTSEETGPEETKAPVEAITPIGTEQPQEPVLVEAQTSIPEGDIEENQEGAGVAVVETPLLEQDEKQIPDEEPDETEGKEVDSLPGKEYMPAPFPDAGPGPGPGVEDRAQPSSLDLLEDGSANDPVPDFVPASHSALLPPTLYFPPGRLTMVESNANLRRIGQILQNGSRFANHPVVNFSVHQGLMIKMRNAFDKRALHNPDIEASFFTDLGNYLTQAHGHIPHAMRPEEVPACIEQAKSLVEQVNAMGRTDGFEQVSRYLLLLANAPLSHF